MTTVTATTPATTVQTQTAAATSAASSGISVDYNMFLKLLTTQMQNQDPLNPTDSTQYTQQLAQYSQVEQSVQQTQALNNILASLSTQGLSQASSFIGKEAQFSSTISGLAGSTPASWAYRATSPISSLNATMMNSAGQVVDTRTVSASGASGRFTWNGQLANGAKAPDGAYTVAMTGTDATGGTVGVTPSSVGIVQNVVNASGTVSLTVNGVQLSEAALVQLASAGAN